MNIVLISLFHCDNFAVRLLFSYLRDNNIPIFYISFKRLRQKAAKILKNDYAEIHTYPPEVTEEDTNALLNQLENLNPALIGINLQSPYFQIARRLTQAIRNKFKVPVVWGGSHPTIDPDNCIKWTDMLCVGEGFDAMLELSKAILEGKPYDKIKNLWLNNDGKIIRNPPRPLLNDLDILPFASYDSKNKIYIDDGQVQTDRNIDYFGLGFTDDSKKAFHQTMTSFGCPMNCSFCINCLDHDRFRRRSVANVIEELIQTKQNNPGLKFICFWDNIFAINKKWCLEFSKSYRQKINLPFFNYSHPLCSDMEIFTALRKAGWAITIMGIQSGSYGLRKTIYGRTETNEQILKATQKLNSLKKVKSCRNYFRIHYDYLSNNPLEGKKDLSESLDLFLKFPKGFIFQPFNISFFPNYPITKYLLKNNYISEKNVEGNATSASANNWIGTFDSKKEYQDFLHQHKYYYLLFSLAQFKSFPNSLIRFIERKRLFYSRLVILYSICRIVRLLELTIRISNYAWLWELFRQIPLKNKLKYRTLIRYTWKGKV